MEISTSKVQIAEPGTAIYMLHWGEHYERRSSGPYLGVPGLDFTALTDDYRRSRYAAAEAAQEDHCSLDEGDFQKWLVEKGILAPMEATDADIELRAYGNEYVPKHWPECPECRNGRGEQEYGDVRRSLNRITAYRRCIECRHEWGHHEVANNSNQPMLDDDGRDTEGGCVPFALSKACGIDWKAVKQVCAKYGWSNNGMHTPHNAALAARELGYELVSCPVPRKGLNHPTLKQVASQLGSGRNYIIGIREHWLALVNGRIVDNDNDSGMTSRVLEIYEVRKSQAIAA